MADKIYVGQTELSIRLITGIDVTGAQSTLIKYKKPDDDNVYSWTASIEDATNGIIYYNIASEEDLDTSGKWKFWAYVVLSSGNIGIGKPTFHDIYDEGE